VRVRVESVVLSIESTINSRVHKKQQQEYQRRGAQKHTVPVPVFTRDRVSSCQKQGILDSFCFSASINEHPDQKDKPLVQPVV